MEYTYHVGECPVCKNYGRMEVIYNFESNRCSVICDECLLEFDTYADFLECKNGYRKSYETAKARSATFEEIVTSEWYPYIVER